MASINGTPSNDTLTGTRFNDAIFGLAGNDILNGGAGNDTLFGTASGVGERDTLIGGAGSDTFYLGDTNAFYDDRQPKTAGIDDYALITDFDPKEDIINLNGRKNDYAISPSPVNLPNGSEIYRRYQGKNELIAIAHGNAKLNLNSDYFRAMAQETNQTPRNRRDGFALQGVTANDETGISVSGGGDVNGDGFDDLLIGSIGQTGFSFGNGTSYLVFGKPNSTNLKLAQLNGNNGFTIKNASGAFGVDVKLAGDVNGDGFDDMIIGANGGEYKGVVSGNKSYVIFGSSQNRSNLTAALNGNNGFTINVINNTNNSNYSDIAVSGAGDINGDGFNDLLIGAKDVANRKGATYVVYGKAGAFNTNVNVDDLNGSNGFTINGITPNERLGTSVSNAGDVNGDRIDDIVIGATDKSYVVYGKAGFGAKFNLATLNGKNGFVINTAGTSVSTAGDVNNDGFDDVIIGANGSSYVVFGKPKTDATLNPSQLNGENGFAIKGKGALAVSNAGDVNGDGFDDVLIGARTVDVNDKKIAGSSYVVFGSGSFNPNLNLDNIKGRYGFVIPGVNAYDRLGTSVSSAGDVNGDGFDDIVIGAPGAQRQESIYGQGPAGESYVVFGYDPGKVTNAGTPGNERLIGTAGNDILIGGRGNDTLIGNQGSDVLYGGAGNDIINFGANDRRVNGGSGTDTLRVNSSGINLDLTKSPNLSNFEIIDITGTGNNSLKLNRLNVLDFSDTTNQLIVNGNAGDLVTSIGQGWTLDDVITRNGVIYDRYTVGAATLLVNENINTRLT